MTLLGPNGAPPGDDAGPAATAAATAATAAAPESGRGPGGRRGRATRGGPVLPTGPGPGDGSHEPVRQPVRWAQAGELVILGLPALVGTVALLLVARKGVYASPDSAFYVGTARNVLDGHGLTAPPGSPPLSHFPPLYPLLLAAVAWTAGLDPIDAAGVVNPLLLGVTALMVALVVRRRSGSVALGVVASVAVVVAVDLLVYYASALSEPLFIVLVLGAALSLAVAVERGSRGSWAAAMALCAGACLTRYVGVALVVAAMAVLAKAGNRKAVVRAGVFGGLALAPLGVWLAAVGRGNRPVVLHLFDRDYWVGGANSISRWVVPPFVPWPLRALVTTAVIAGLAWLFLAGARAGARPGDGRRRSDALGPVLTAFTVAYLIVLLVTRLFFDATGRLDLRFFAVLHVVAIVGLLPWLHRMVVGRARRPVAAGGLLLLGLLGLEAGSWVVAGFTDTGVGRRGLTAAAWRESPVLHAVVALGPDVPVYSNAPEAVFLLTGRSTSPLPAHTDYLSDRRRSSYEAELSAVGERLAAADGVVVWFRPYAFRERFVAAIADLDVEPVLEDDVATLSRPPR